MSVLHIEFPPPKVHGTIKGTSFIASADKHHTIVRLQLDPAKRRSQVHIFKQCLEALGPPIGTGPIIFQRVEKTVSASFFHDVSAKVVRPDVGLWAASPAMLRALLAVAHGLNDGVVAPQDITDFAHLIWLLREKEGEAWWGWLGIPTQGTSAHVSANGLTPVFAGAKMVLVNGEPIARKGALRGLPVPD